MTLLILVDCDSGLTVLIELNAVIDHHGVSEAWNHRRPSSQRRNIYLFTEARWGPRIAQCTIVLLTFSTPNTIEAKVAVGCEGFE